MRVAEQPGMERSWTTCTDIMLSNMYVIFYVKLPSNKNKQTKDPQKARKMNNLKPPLWMHKECSVSMTEAMKQGKLVLGEVTFPEHTLCISQQEQASLFSSTADTSFLYNALQLKTSKLLFVLKSQRSMLYTLTCG